MPWLRRALNTLAWLLLCSGLPMAAWAGAAEVQTLDQGGVTVSLRFDTLSDGAAQAQIGLADSASGRALGGARPAAWLLRRHSEQVASEASCDAKAAALMSGSLGARATVDLNSYRLVTLNHDHTLAFINPHVGLQNSKLESIVQLPGLGHDWVYAPATQRLFVSLREQHAVAVVDVATRTLLHTEATGAGSLPTRLALDEAGQRVWVGLDGAAEVLALDTTRGRSTARVAVGQGLHTLVAAEGSPWLFVGNAGSDSVSLVDRATLRRVADVPVGRTPVDMAWSAAAQRLAVLSANAGELRLIDPQAAAAGQPATAATTTARIALAHGALVLGLFDNGRRALVLNGRTDTVSLLDLATGRVVAELASPGQPDQLAFSREFAYVRGQTTAKVQVINLAQAREGRLQAVAVPMGRASPAEAPQAINVAGVFAPAPEGNGMLVANPGDASIYRYAEGMMVPVGSFSNYRRQARALRVLDTSLAERAPGQFEAAVRVEQGGRYDLVVRNLRPAVTACFVVEAQGVAALPGVAMAPVPRLLSLRQGEPGEAVLAFELRDATGQPVDALEAQVLAVQVRGTQQLRAPVQSLGQGRHIARLKGLQPGQFEWMVQDSALNIRYEHGRLGRLAWPPAEGPAPSANSATSNAANNGTVGATLTAAQPVAAAATERQP
ncbi:MAG: YncE family protein [Vitreoscilla sp.]|nr:YncE family protein [Vitreoscilla sp.]